ncbi:hypothetical protein [Brachybacterium subflavum]|uniref:hypothetical protein n=1 Tax=Brachybacterium subflavum TaxID=2585206 RepID=UPI0012667267|nr:hypothetical protein [Brachybacterium subflavum]
MNDNENLEGGPAAVPDSAGAKVETAGAFDIRNFIGLLVALFGVILLLVGLFDFTDVEAAKTGGVNANLWAGIVMVVVGLLFAVWAKVEPIRMIVSENEEGAEEPRDIAGLD